MRRLPALALAAALCMSLAGCGASGAENLLTESAGIRPGAVLVTVNGRKVEAERYLYWLCAACDELAARYPAAGGGPDWTRTVADGKTLADYAGAQALKTVTLYEIVEDWADTYDCGLTAEDRRAMEQDRTAAETELGGQTACRAAMADRGLDEELLSRLTGDSYLYSHLYALFCRPEGARYPGAETLRSYASAQGCMTADTYCLSTADAADDAARSARRQQAEKALASLGAAPDPASAFASLAEHFGGEVRTGLTFTPGDGTLPAACGEAAAGLTAGAWSGVVESPEGCWLVLRRELDLTAVAGDYFDRLLQEAADGAEVTCADACRDLDVPSFYAALTAARSAASSGAGAASSAASSGTGAASSAASSGTGTASSGTGTASPAASSGAGAASRGGTAAAKSAAVSGG